MRKSEIIVLERSKQMYWRSRTLVDKRYVLIFLIFKRSDSIDTIFEILCDVKVTVTVQDISAQGELECDLSVN